MRAKSGEFFGTYGGIVVSNVDSLKIGRVKVRVPLVHGVKESAGGLVSDSDLPWAWPAGLPAGAKPESGAISWLPNNGDSVWVRFLDGELDKPIWEWGNQTISQPKNFTLAPNSYESDGSATRRAALTRFEHLVELVPGGVSLKTKNNYQVLLADSDKLKGAALLRTGKGQMLHLDDLANNSVLYGQNIVLKAATFQQIQVTNGWSEKVDEDGNQALNCPGDSAANINGDGIVKIDGTFTMLIGNFILTVQENSLTIEDGAGTTLSLDGDGSAGIVTENAAVALNSDGSVQVSSGDVSVALDGDKDKATITANQVSINGQSIALGQGASEPAVLGNQLFAFLTEFIIWASTHTHSNGNEGSPTGAPIIPPAPVVQAEICSESTNVI
jgi:hypothetical protein